MGLIYGKTDLYKKEWCVDFDGRIIVSYPTYPVSISNGGTGATTAADALVNFGLTATATELNYCDGVTSAIQTQMDNKLPSSKLTSGTNIPTYTGTTGDVYVRTPYNPPVGSVEISTPEELVAFATRVNGGETSLNACLKNDIDMTDVSWTPIGNSLSYKYTGTFDGQCHVISNLTLSQTDDDAALFGTVYSGGKIQNVYCEGFNITGTQGSACLVGYLFNNSIVSNCYAKDCNITGSMRVGALVGFVTDGGEIINSFVSNCTVSLSSQYSSRAGALVGDASGSANISNCYVYNCTMSGTNSVGGLLGEGNESMTISNCAIYGGTHGDTLVGSGSPTITNCYTSNDITSELFHTQGFWDGNGISGTVYLSWDFINTWEWNSTTTLPNLKVITIGNTTSLYAYNGSSWVQQNTLTPYVQDGTLYFE